MNLDLQALAKNKPALIGAGVVGVVGLGLYSRSKKGEAAPAAADPAGSYSGGGQVAGAGGAYDSTASDIYGALSPQLLHIGDQLDKLVNTPKPPTPVPAPTTKPAPGASTAPPKKATSGGTPKPAPKPTAKPAPKPTPVTKPKYAVDQWVTVKPGDNLSAIAARYKQQGITAQSIYTANRGVIGSNINLIRPGQKLHVFGN